MGFERHAITSAKITSAKPPVPAKVDAAALRDAATVVEPLRPADPSREAGILRLARQMRGEWRKERYSRLAGN